MPMLSLTQSISLLLTIGLSISTAAMVWKAGMVLTNCADPIIVVLGGGMGFAGHSRGDLLVLTNYYAEPIRAGDTVVFRVKGRDIHIFHRVIKVHEKSDGDAHFLTKGDESYLDDRGLYAPGQLWLERKDIIGKVKGWIPYLGIVAMLMKDFFQLDFPVSVVIIFSALSYHRWRSMFR